MPLMQYIFISRPGEDLHVAEHVSLLMKKTAPGASVLTDQPAMVAWYCDRLGVWLPQREQDLATLEKTFGSFDASYVTMAVSQIPTIQKGDWWYWVTVPTGVFHGLSPVEPAPPRAALRVRAVISSK